MPSVHIFYWAWGKSLVMPEEHCLVCNDTCKSALSILLDRGITDDVDWLVAVTGESIEADWLVKTSILLQRGVVATV